MSIKKEGIVELMDEALDQVTGGGAIYNTGGGSLEEIACGGKTVEDSIEKLYDAPQGRAVPKGKVENIHFKDIPLSKLHW